MEELDYRTIGEKIAKRRTAQGFTQEAVANLLDVNPSHISNIEHGRAHPSLTTLVRIANILHCSVDCFLDGEYTYTVKDSETALDDRIMDLLKFCDSDKKQRILKMIELM